MKLVLPILAAMLLATPVSSSLLRSVKEIPGLAVGPLVPFGQADMMMDHTTYELLNITRMSINLTDECLCPSGSFWYARGARCIEQGGFGIDCSVAPMNLRGQVCQEGLTCKGIEGSREDQRMCMDCTAKDGPDSGCTSSTEEDRMKMCEKVVMLVGEACTTVRIWMPVTASGSASATATAMKYLTKEVTAQVTGQVNQSTSDLEPSKTEALLQVPSQRSIVGQDVSGNITAVFDTTQEKSGSATKEANATGRASADVTACISSGALRNFHLHHIGADVLMDQQFALDLASMAIQESFAKAHFEAQEKAKAMVLEAVKAQAQQVAAVEAAKAAQIAAEENALRAAEEELEDSAQKFLTTGAQQQADEVARQAALQVASSQAEQDAAKDMEQHIAAVKAASYEAEAAPSASPAAAESLEDTEGVPKSEPQGAETAESPELKSVEEAAKTVAAGSAGLAPAEAEKPAFVLSTGADPAASPAAAPSSAPASATPFFVIHHLADVDPAVAAPAAAPVAADPAAATVAAAPAAQATEVATTVAPAFLAMDESEDKEEEELMAKLKR